MTRWFQRNLSGSIARFTATLLFFSPVLSRAAEGEARGVLPELRVKSLTSESGRFTVVGDDPTVSQELLRWVEQVAGRLEDILQVPITGSSSPFLVSHFAGTNTPAGRVEAGIVFEKGIRSYRLSFLNSYLVQADRAESELVRLLADYWVDCRTGREPAEEGHPDGVASNRVPEWFSEGVRQNMNSGRKARNSEWILDAWESGSVPPLAVFFSGTGRRAGTDPLMMQAQAGLVVGWLVSLPDSPARFRRIQARLGDGLPPDHWWLATSIWEVADKRALDDAWDRWILKQRNMVYQPGVPTKRAVARLKDELVLVPGKGGIPSGVDLPDGAGLDKLLDLRKAKWLPACVRHKTAAIRLLATGRGKELTEIADLYCRFLDGLDGWSGRERLEGLLKEADGRLAGLEHGLETEIERILNAVPVVPANVFE